MKGHSTPETKMGNAEPSSGKATGVIDYIVRSSFRNSSGGKFSTFTHKERNPPNLRVLENCYELD